MTTFYPQLVTRMPSKPHRLFARAIAGLDIIFDLLAEVQQMRCDAHDRYPFIDE